MGPWAAKQDAQVLSRCVLHFTSLILWGELSKARVQTQNWKGPAAAAFMALFT